ncbi:MAG: ATP synthase F1 subunit gamma [Clostridia bacterium]|nr:ATP synthase F1 subunit gamma [Clostridia bacterium]
MGKDIKSLKNRIKSINSTLHLTNAMGLVASAKIRSATENMNKSRQYKESLDETVSLLTSAKECEKSAYMQKKSEGKICYIVIAGDRGLAGGYNANITRLVATLPEAEIIPIGKKVCERYGKEILKAETFSYEDAAKLAKELCQGFKDGKYKEVSIVSTKYVSMMTQTPEVNTVLPLKKGEKINKGALIYEPDELTVLEAVIEEYISASLIKAVRESFACEVVARRFAMDSAGKNASEMIDNLKLEYNRARQSTITQEITEIVAGSDM